MADQIFGNDEYEQIVRETLVNAFHQQPTLLEFEAIVRETLTTVLKLGKVKGSEYSGDDDRLLNFRRNGRKLRVPAELVLMVYAGKHWDSLVQYAADIAEGKQRERSEPIEGRIDDLILYMLLYKCMYREKHRQDPPRG